MENYNQIFATTQINYTTASKFDKFRLKHQDIKIFDLHFPNFKNLRAIINDNRLIYTNINNFKKYIIIFIKSKITQTNYKKILIIFHIQTKTKEQIISFFFILFVDSTVI